MKNMISSFNPSEFRNSLHGFWDHVTEICEESRCVSMSLPLLQADGWQVTVHIVDELNGCVSIRDMGQMRSWLAIRGFSIDSSSCNEIENLKSDFGVCEDELGYYKLIRFPVPAREIHLFGSFLSAVSYLIFKLRADTHTGRKEAYDSVNNVAQTVAYKCIKGKRYNTKYREMNVDFSFLKEKKTVLVQTFDQKTTATDAMELWSARLREIAESQENVTGTAMVYDEDTCNLKTEVINVAKGRGNLVLPSHRLDELKDFIDSGVA